MKCPEGTVEVAVWDDSVFFDEEHKVTDKNPIAQIRVNGYGVTLEEKQLYRRVVAALKPVTDLGGEWITGDAHVHLFDPEVFEELTKEITDEVPGWNR